MTFCYINVTSIMPPRDKVYLKGLRQLGVEIIEITDNSSGLKKLVHLFKKHRKIRNDYDVLWVGYTAHLLVPFARLISRKKVIFNALASLYEGIIISRAQVSRYSIRAVSCWLIDFLAFHLASVSLVESNSQKDYLQKMFFLSDKKLIRAWTGADTDIFYYDATINKLPKFTVLFRGGFLPESGIEYLIEAINILRNEDIDFRIIGTGMMKERAVELIEKYGLTNIEWIKDRLSSTELRIKMQECHISLGQLSNHNRLERTIPHKAFESIAMKLPYLTARNKAILELLKENETCFCCNPADAQDLANKLLETKNDENVIKKIIENAYKLQVSELMPRELAQHFLNSVKI